MTMQAEAVRLFESGRDALESGDYETALKLLSMSLSYSRRPEAYLLKAKAQLKKNDLDLAMREAEYGLTACDDKDSATKDELLKFKEHIESLTAERKEGLEKFREEISRHKEGAIKGSSANAFASAQKKPSLRLDLVPANGSRSRFRGEPLVPENFEWPVRQDGTRLAFLGQIDFEETASYASMQKELPRSGMLSFFYDTDEQPWGNSLSDKDGWRVYYFPKEIKLEPYPDEGGANEEQFSVLWAEEPSYPDTSSDEYFTLNESARTEYETFVENCYEEAPFHCLLGHPYLVQSDFRESVELVTQGLNYQALSTDIQLAKKVFDDSRRWRLLLQLDSDPGPNFEWGDGGVLYFCIDESALKKLDFSNVWVELQCT
jgi:uncharacterized protein YwqG